jgi:hypothetical protein
MRIAGFAALTTVFVLSACGSGSSDSYQDTSPDTIANDVSDAMKDVSSLHMVGTLTQGGQNIDVDLAMSESGNCEGTMSFEGQGSLDLIVTDGSGFFKPDEQFWRSQAGAQADAVIGQVGDKWVAVTGQMAPATAACDWNQFTGGFDDPKDNKIKEVTGTDEVDGEDTVTVTFESDDGNPGVANVLASDPHYIVKMQVEKQGELTFSEFGDPVEPEAPTDVIDLQQLQ